MKRIIFVLLLSTFYFLLPTSCLYAENNLGIGLGYPYLGVKYNFAKFSSEGRFATGEGINVYAGRGYWNFYSDKKLNGFTGIEGGYITFDTLDIKGSGAEGAIFLGGEYFFTKRLSVAMDFSPTFIALNSDDIKIDGVEFVFNLSLYYRLFGDRDSSHYQGRFQKNKKPVQFRRRTSWKETNYIYAKVTDNEGNPLPKTTIKISQAENIILKESTDGSGEYKSNELSLGTYTVKAWKQGYITEEKDVEVSADNTAEVNFVLKKK